jgi:hypothetical protein
MMYGTDAVYELLGPGYEVDAIRATVTGPLVAPTSDDRILGPTGIKIEIRSGGPIVEYEPADELMWADPGITFGNQGADEQLLAATRGRAVHADPVVLMWDQDLHPESAAPWPVYGAMHTPLPEDLQPGGLATNDHLAPIGLP